MIEWRATGRVAAGVAGARTIYKHCTPMFGDEHVRRADPKVTPRRPAPTKPTDVDALNERIKEFEQELANAKAKAGQDDDDGHDWWNVDPAQSRPSGGVYRAYACILDFGTRMERSR